MSKSFLNKANVVTLAVQVCCECVTQHVWVNPLLDSGLHSTPRHHLLDVSCRNRSPRQSCENVHWGIFDNPRLTLSPASEQPEISISDPENPISRALAFADEELAAVQVQIAPLQPCCLGQSETGVEHQGQHEPIAFTGRISWVWLPEKRRLLSYRLKGQRTDRVECRGRVCYQVGFQLEPVEPEVFWTFQHELAMDGERNGMLHKFDSSGRIALGALSYINVETRNRSMLVQAFHTFPDDCAIVKSQSIFQLP